MKIKLIKLPVLLVLTLSNIKLITSDTKPWRIIRKEGSAAHARAQEIKKDLSQLFELMHPRSKVRQICLEQAEDVELDCQLIANALYCAQKKTPAQEMFCRHVDTDVLWNIRGLAKNHKLSYLRTKREEGRFADTIKALSK
jgi:hypothetical protein